MAAAVARCPRCKGHLMPTYNEDVCSICGYVEWGSRSKAKSSTDSNGNVTPKKAAGKAPPLQPAWALFGYGSHQNPLVCQANSPCTKAVKQDEAYCRLHRSRYVALWGTQAPSWRAMSIYSRLGVAFMEYEIEKSKPPVARISGLFLPEAVGPPTHSTLSKCRVYSRIKALLERKVGMPIRFWKDAVQYCEYYTGGQPWNLRLPPDWRDSLDLNKNLRLDRSTP